MVEKYCLAVEPTRSYVYTQAWVEKIVREIGTPEKFEQFVGHAPKKGKMTPIDAARQRSASEPPVAAQDVS